MRVGIVGGGVSGVAAARRLAQHGLESVVYERNAMLGGRLGSLSMPGTKEMVGVGCSYIKAKSPEFKAAVDRWVSEGKLASWEAADPHTISAPGIFEPLARPEGEQWFCGVPHAASFLDLTSSKDQDLITLETGASGDISAASFDVSRQCWSLQRRDPSLPAAIHSKLLLALPIVDSEKLLSTGATVLQNVLPADIRAADYQKSRFSGAFVFASSLELPFGFGLMPKGSFITVLINDSSRTPWSSNRSEKVSSEAWVVQTETKWAAERIAMLERGHCDMNEVASELRDEFARVIGRTGSLPELLSASAVPWTYGDADYELPGGCAWLEDEGLALCGDWAFNGRVEGAWLSGTAAADHALTALGIDL